MTNRMEVFKTEVQEKINNLLQEFSEGKLNREQFYAIYERYNSQIELAEKALQGADVQIDDSGATVVLREKYMGKARGMMVYANEGGNVIETLGNFNVSMTEMIGVLDKFTRAVASGHTLERVVRRVSDEQWVLFVPGQYTTAVTQFNHEPSRYQTVVIQRMHTEFENANRPFFINNIFDPEELVFPFLSFVQKQVR